jgi:hypothetical protein
MNLHLLIKSELITTIFVSLVSILRTQSGYSTMQKSWSDHFSNLREEWVGAIDATCRILHSAIDRQAHFNSEKYIL